MIHAPTLLANLLLTTLAVLPAADARLTLRVAAFGAVGDGVHDDGPALAAAFEAAKADGSPSTVVFEKKTLSAW
jgi:hypothetical protein